MTARDDYPLLATAERYEEFGEARRALDEIDSLREALALFADDEPACFKPDDCGICQANRALGRIP